jgi:serine-type D-Ala-D-Ala carboxypeptidase (penicillin-binding protein 5/6)
MSVLRDCLTGCLVVGWALLLLPASGDAAGSRSDNSAQALRLSTGKSAQVKTPRAHKRKAMPRPAPPEGILLKDLKTGEILFQENADQPMAPASLTKIMSAIVILEEGNLDDDVTVSRRAAAAHRIKLYLKPGQVLPLRSLLKAMLIRSANDACLAAVEHVAGDEDSFVEKMNAKALAIGLTRTHFQNACGFDMPEHYSTAEELAALTEYAMAQETFAAIVREPSAVIRTVNQRKAYIARTTNRLLGTMEGVIGVKTGFTRGAGRCLIAVVSREEKELLLVLLNARHRWGRAQNLIEYGLRPPDSSAVAFTR